MKKSKFKKEKHIKQRYSERTKLWSFQVYFVYQDALGNRNSYTATFNEKDFINSKHAFDEACKHRDIMLHKLHTCGISNKKYNLSTIFDFTKNLMPLRLETYKKLELILNKYIINVIGDKYINDITALDIYTTLNNMVSTASDDTIQRVFSLWKKLFHTARVHKVISINITEEIIVPKSEKIKKVKDVNTSYATLQQVIQALKNHTKQNDRDIYNTCITIFGLMIMYHIGLRPAECFALTREDIDLFNKLVHINKEIGSSYTAFNVIREPKTPNSNRKIPIVPDLEKVLIDLIEYSKYDYLLSEYSGNLFDIDIITNKINRVCKLENLEFNMYRLRHQFSTDLIIKQKADPRTIMELMGHNNPNMTIEYARSDDKLKREILNKKRS